MSLIQKSLLLLAGVGILLSVREGCQKRQLSQRYQKLVSEIDCFDGYNREDVFKHFLGDMNDTQDGVLIAPLSSDDPWHFRWKVFVPPKETLTIKAHGFDDVVTGPDNLIVELCLFETRNGLRVITQAKQSTGSPLLMREEARLSVLEAKLPFSGPLVMKNDETKSLLQIRIPDELGLEKSLIYELQFLVEKNRPQQDSDASQFNSEGANL